MDERPPEARPLVVLVATGLGLFMIFLDATIVNVALPDIQNEFDAGIAAITYALVEGPHSGWTSPLILALLLGSMVIITAFVRVERRVTDPMMDLRVSTTVSTTRRSPPSSACCSASTGPCW